MILLALPSGAQYGTLGPVASQRAHMLSEMLRALGRVWVRAGFLPSTHHRVCHTM